MFELRSANSPEERHGSAYDFGTHCGESRVGVTRRSALRFLAFAPLLALLCTHALALDRHRTIGQFSHTAWTVREGAQILALLQSMPMKVVSQFLQPLILSRTVWFMLLCAAIPSLLLWVVFALRLRQVTGQLRARLAERERIARELHDTLLQSIHGLILRFQTATERLPVDEPVRLLLEEALGESDRVLADGRDLVLELKVSSTQASELPKALAVVGEALKEDHPAAFRVVVCGEPRELQAVVRDEAYRIGREALTNAFQHSKAAQIEVEIAYNLAELRIGILDDGCGIDTSILKHGHRSGQWGLPGIRERAQKVGAHFDVWTRPGGGTEVELRVPAAIAYRSVADVSRWQWLRRLVTGALILRPPPRT
jgi:signal transduction histidine kinase